jgi:hypothetical protein
MLWMREEGANEELTFVRKEYREGQERKREAEGGQNAFMNTSVRFKEEIEKYFTKKFTTYIRNLVRILSCSQHPERISLTNRSIEYY